MRRRSGNASLTAPGPIAPAGITVLTHRELVRHCAKLTVIAATKSLHAASPLSPIAITRPTSSPASPDAVVQP